MITGVIYYISTLIILIYNMGVNLKEIRVRFIFMVNLVPFVFAYIVTGTIIIIIF